MSLSSIEKKIEAGKPFTSVERNFLIEDIFDAYLKGDDPRQDQANQKWLEDMSDEDLYFKYKDYVINS